MNGELPPFYCPIRPAVHPRVRQIERRAIAWLDETGLYADEIERAWGLATNSAELVCRVLPACPDDTAWLFSAWNYWSFALDDGQADTSAAAVADFNAEVIRALEEPGYRPPRTSRFNATLAELIARTRSRTTAVQFRRLAEGMRDWLLAGTWQIANAERRVMPALDDFAAMRPLANGTRLFAAWIEIGNGLVVPGERRWTASVQALTAAAGFIVSCDNDLIGYARNDDREIPAQNIVNVLMRQRHCSFRDAVAEAVAIRDRTLNRFLRLRHRLILAANPELRRYVEGLGRYIRGCLDWMNGTPRYASPRNHHDLPVPGASLNLVITPTPTDQSSEPPDIPSIKWWWEL